MNLNTTITCLVCGTILVGVVTADSVFCSKCKGLPIHNPEQNFIQVYGGTAAANLSEVSSSVISSIKL